MTGNQAPKSVDITKEAMENGPEVSAAGHPVQGPLWLFGLEGVEGVERAPPSPHGPLLLQLGASRPAWRPVAILMCGGN